MKSTSIESSNSRILEFSAAIRLKKGREEDVRTGIPWIYSSDIVESSELLHVLPGSLVAIENHKGQPVGTGYYNAKSQIACRVLSLKREPIDVTFFKTRFAKALTLRDELIGAPYYRLAHSEADGLPGLLVDRFGDILVAQAGTAGIENLQPLWMQALEELLHPKAIILRNDIPARALEGLKQEVTIFPSPLEGESGDPTRVAGAPGEGVFKDCLLRDSLSLTLSHQGRGDYLVEVMENNCIYYADLIKGQKTGWFYDQRDNRKMVAELAKGKTLLDVYAHSGGFGILAAKYGAAYVTLVDSSKLALQLAQQAARRNDVACDTIQGDAFETMERLHEEGKRFDIVLADPPAFVKSRKDIAAGLKGYEKVARMATRLVNPDGLLFIASCSHHAGRAAFNKAVQDGIAKAGRDAILFRQTGAAPDHPRHKYLQQNDYLKGILLEIVN